MFVHSWSWWAPLATQHHVFILKIKKINQFPPHVLFLPPCCVIWCIFCPLKRPSGLPDPGPNNSLGVWNRPPTYLYTGCSMTRAHSWETGGDLLVFASCHLISKEMPNLYWINKTHTYPISIPWHTAYTYNNQAQTKQRRARIAMPLNKLGSGGAINLLTI